MSQNIGDIKISILLEILQAEKNSGKFTTSLKALEAQAGKTTSSVSKLSGAADSFKSVLGGVVAGGVLTSLISSLRLFTQESILMGAEFQELSSNFIGTTKDIELFRKATSGTVSDGSLIKLSNYASDLGVNLGDQAKLFSLAEDAADKYGGGVEANFQRVIQASDGSARGLRTVGIATKDFEQEVDKLTKTLGVKLTAMSAEEQMNIRLQAIYNLTGVSLDSINQKIQSNADKIAGLSVAYDNLKIIVGVVLGNAFSKLAGDIGQTTNAFDANIQKAEVWGQKIAVVLQGIADVMNVKGGVATNNPLFNLWYNVKQTGYNIDEIGKNLQAIDDLVINIPAPDPKDKIIKDSPTNYGKKIGSTNKQVADSYKEVIKEVRTYKDLLTELNSDVTIEEIRTRLLRQKEIDESSGRVRGFYGPDSKDKRAGKAEVQETEDSFKNMLDISNQIQGIFNFGGDTLLGKFINAMQVTERIVALLKSLQIAQGIFDFISSIFGFALAPVTGGESMALNNSVGGSINNVQAGRFLSSQSFSRVEKVPYAVTLVADGRNLKAVIKAVDKIDNARTK